MSDVNGVDTLTEMGFLRNRAEKAWTIMGGRGVQAAMEWLLEHNEDPDIDEPYQQPKGHSLKSDSTSEPETMDTGNPDQPSPELVLTPEEKAERVKQFQEKIHQRRLEKEKMDEKRGIEMEKSRRKDGKDLNKIKSDMQWKEAQKQADIRRREKREDVVARQRVKEQIARDRADKKAQQEKEKLATSEGAAPHAEKPTSPAAQTAAKTDHTHARLQIRLPNGSQMVQRFGSHEELAAVRLYIELNRKDGSNEPFALMTAFPKKIFTEEELGMSLQMLGLAPSAVLIVTKQR